MPDSIQRPGTTSDKREWVFFRNSGGSWCWELRVNGTTVRECSTDFVTREECVADAANHGFNAESTAHAQVARRLN